MDSYIKTGSGILENGRLGILPDELNLLLQNNQELFVVSESNKSFLRNKSKPSF